MTSLPEQFSAVRKWQLDTQFDFFRAVTTRVIESTEQVIALNIDTSRAAAERSADAVRQLFSASEPRDLLNLGGQGQEQFQQMLAYTRELFTIMAGAGGRLASGAGTAVAPMASAAAVPQPAQPAQPAQAADADARIGAAEDEAEAGAAGKRVKPSKKPLVATAPEAVAPEPAGAEKPIARAAGKLAPKAAAAQHPMASPVVSQAAEVAVPPVKPVEAAPPPPPASGTPEIDARQAQMATFKNGRKK